MPFNKDSRGLKRRYEAIRTSQENETIYLSIVIPAFNEEERINKTISKIESYLKTQNYSYEIIVVDDGSKDNTATIIRDSADYNHNVYLLQNKENKGKGYSVKRGMLKARGEYILFSDADLSTPIKEVEKLFPLFNRDYDIVIGSRGLTESNIVVHQPFYRENMGRIFSNLVQLLTVKGIKDTQCGFKCFRGDVARDIFNRQTMSGFCFDVEVLYIASKSGYRIKEVPIIWYNSPKSKVNPLTDPLKMLLDLLRIRFNSFKHIY
ncbi:MAG: dolichyl-phosphate beta-glucosyltransferase [Candidatus Scalinduaceae bacterium]